MTRGPGRDSERRDAADVEQMSDEAILGKARPALPTPEEVEAAFYKRMSYQLNRGGKGVLASLIAARDAAHAADRARAVDEALARVEGECRARAKASEPGPLMSKHVSVYLTLLAEFIAALRAELAR